MGKKIDREKTPVEQQYDEIKRKVGKTDADFAAAFGYSTVHSFRNATRYDKLIAGIVYTYRLTNPETQKIE